MARSTLGDFINFVKRNNIAKSNRFNVTFNIPAAMTQTPAGALGVDSAGAQYMKLVGNFSSLLSTQQITDAAANISLTCLMVDIPSRQQSVSEINYGSFVRKVVNGRTFGDVNTTFLLTGQYIEKTFFDHWLSIMNDESNTAVEFYDNYISTVKVDCLDNQNNVVYSFTLDEAFPVSIGSVRLDRTSQNQQMLLDVSWTFHRVVYADAQSQISNPIAGSDIPPSAIIGASAGKNRLFPIPGLDSFSSAVQSAVSTVKEFRGQLQGALAVANDVRQQVRDAKMQVLDGVKTINGVVKDFKAIANVPTDVKNEVVNVLNDTKNQLGSLKTDVKDFRKYPTK